MVLIGLFFSPMKNVANPILDAHGFRCHVGFLKSAVYKSIIHIERILLKYNVYIFLIIYAKFNFENS